MWYSDRMNPLATLITWLYILSAVGADFISICYFTNWAYERPIPSARFSIKDIDPHLCSHLIYAFVNIDSKELVLKSPSQFEESRYEEFNKLKIKNKHLKTLLSVGGQHARSNIFTAVSSQPQTIQRFAKTSAKFLRDRDFDGIDIDWEYPGETENTKHQFTKLLMGLREEFELEAKESGKERLLITIAVPAGKERIDDGYEVEQISRYVDYIDIMAYDYFGPWNKISGFNSPLFPRFSNPKFSKELNMKWTVDEWLRKKAPREKIVVGMTGAGCSFTLNDTKSHDVGDPVDSGGVKGNLYLLEGRLVYPEICDMNDAGGTVVYDEEQQVPYLYKGDQWVGFDNIRSIQAKVNWMIKEGFAGAMFWTIDFDDFSGTFCHEGKYPLLSAIRNEIAKNSVHPVLNKVVPKPVMSAPGGLGPELSYSSLLLMMPLAFSLVQIFY